MEAKKRLSDIPNFFHVIQFDPSEQSNVIRTFNSTPRGNWDCKYNPNFHETICPIAAIPTRNHVPMSDPDIELEFAKLSEFGKPISFDTVSHALRCVSHQEVCNKLKTYAGKIGKKLHGSYMSTEGTMII